MKHPVFWNSSTRMAFLQAVHEKYRTCNDLKGLAIHMKASKQNFIGVQKNWMKRLDSVEYVKHLRSKSLYVETCPVDLLSAIRNTTVHYNDVPSLFKVCSDGFYFTWNNVFIDFFFFCIFAEQGSI